MSQPLRRVGNQLPLGKLAIALIVVILLYNSFFVVKPSDEAGVRWLGGTVITKQPLDTGLHFKVPFLEDVDRLQTSRSVYTLNNLSVYTNDNQSVELSISVIYEIPSASVLNLLYHVGRSGNVDIDDTILPVVRDRALAAFAQYNTLNISDERAKISAKMKSEISEALHRLFGIQVIDVQLTGIKYSPVFVASVEAAVKAKADAVRAQNTVLQKKYEGEQKTVTATAEAQARIARAKGEAQSIILEADAQAKAIKTVGDALRVNPQYVRYYGIKHWNGVMPQVVGSKGTLPMIDLGKHP
ncbi:SPFH domain-containing protein [Oleiagrimonas soli]|uniref:Regulator of protease activity HflC (Stomatin/prohibitin superfamily) n=1 Tax=Oleiagrimonas soli TaxID=1543381 RepID=A0A099CW58_9GAMM|nr:prohibitin family protein [Oleiagrimonas soli]KGI77896.1 hypothetical protein LF63_0105705 [Oleiagrimonas soli]MBB6183741.1 regulator of protease activity HflC (stomatin/prohibitin superfamily) [Oleiagrimonas soli]